jgi:hypothetical protein
LISGALQVIPGQFLSELAEEERLYGWFQRDSATAHTAHISRMQAFSDVFGDRIISSVFGQNVHMILILVSFLLGLFEGQSLQQ